MWVKVHRGFKSHRYRQSKGPTRMNMRQWGPSSFHDSHAHVTVRRGKRDGDARRCQGRGPTSVWISATGTAASCQGLVSVSGAAVIVIGAPLKA